MRASAPGRIDLLNTHQDYKGLPVVSAAVDLRAVVELEPAGGPCRFRSADTGDECSFRPGEPPAGRSFCDYMKAAVAAAGWRGGCVAELRSWVPIGAGMGSSAAITVAAVAAFRAAAGLSAEPGEVAELAYRAERELMGIPCGRLDQYGSAFGGISLIHPRPPVKVERLPSPGGHFTVLDSGIRHSTAEVHPARQRELDEALRLLSQHADVGTPRHDLADWGRVAAAAPLFDLLPDTARRRLLFTVEMQRSTEAAVELLRGGTPRAPYLPPPGLPDWRLKALGAVMTHQHRLLAELYDVSLPRLDRLVEEALEAGAYGAKLSGAGLGGVVVALSPDRETAERVGRLSDAQRWWVVEVDEGLKVEWSSA